MASNDPGISKQSIQYIIYYDLVLVVSAIPLNSFLSVNGVVISCISLLIFRIEDVLRCYFLQTYKNSVVPARDCISNKIEHNNLPRAARWSTQLKYMTTFQTTFRIPKGSVLKYLCRGSAWPGGVPQVCAVRKKGFFRTFRIVILVDTGVCFPHQVVPY